MRVLYSEEELEALDTVSPLAERLYRQLRRRMDMNTFTVGRGDSRISRGVLAIYSQYTPPHGSQNPPWKATNRQIDVLIDELARNGLVRRVATPQERMKLVLSFPLASLRAENERRMSVTHERYICDGVEIKKNQSVTGYFDVCERDESAGAERDISVYLSDEMRAADGGGYPQDRAEMAAERSRYFVRAIGDAGDVQVFKACQVVRSVAMVRDVCEDEIRLAIVSAKQAGASSVAAYAAKVIQQGSLIVSVGAGGDSARKASAMMDVAQVEISPRHREIATRAGLSLKDELERFVLRQRSTGRRAVDWAAAFEEWLLRSERYLGGLTGVDDLPWHMSASGIEAKARELGYVPPAGMALGQWKYEVFALAGLTRKQRGRDLVDYA